MSERRLRHLEIAPSRSRLGSDEPDILVGTQHQRSADGVRRAQQGDDWAGVMAGERVIRKRALPPSRAVGSGPVLRVGPWNVSVTALAWGLSAVLHAGLLTTSYLVTWGPAPVSNPEIEFARGDQTARIEILLEPWPAPAEAVGKTDEAREEAAPAESPDPTVRATKAEVAPLAEEVLVEEDFDPAVSETEERDSYVRDDQEITENEAVEDDSETRPAEDAPESERELPDVSASAKESVAPATAEPIHSDATASGTVGVETGASVLHLPTPRYPSLSRKRGEEGEVLLRVEVLPDGRVGAINVLDDAGFARLAKAAMAAARAGRFKPATRDGRPIRATVRIPFRFVLR